MFTGIIRIPEADRRILRLPVNKPLFRVRSGDILTINCPGSLGFLKRVVFCSFGGDFAYEFGGDTGILKRQEPVP